jgi:hypothetical protein
MVSGKRIRGGCGDVGDFDIGLDAGHPAFQSADDRFSHAVLFRPINVRITFAQIRPIAVIVRRQEAGDGGLAFWGEGRIEMKE